jgi:hypothetical protein
VQVRREVVRRRAATVGRAGLDNTKSVSESSVCVCLYFATSLAILLFFFYSKISKIGHLSGITGPTDRQ